MKKSTLKKGGIVLLGATTLFGSGVLSWAGDAPEETVVLKAVAPWFVDQTDFDPDAAGILQNYPKVDLSVVSAAHKDVTAFCSRIDFSKFTKDGLDGVYVNFDNRQSDEAEIFGGQLVNLTYDEVQNHEIINTGSVFKVGLNEENSNYGLGIYPGYNANAQVEFVYSTKGLTNVTDITLDLDVFGNKNKINLKRTWNYHVRIYNLDGTENAALSADQTELLITDYDQAGTSHNAKSILSTANGGKWTPGSLDNKIIRVIISSDNATPDPDSPFMKANPSASAETEALLVINDVHIDFKRPEVAFGKANDTEFNAGAGRSTVCKPATLETTVDFWKSAALNNEEAVIDPETQLDEFYNTYGYKVDNAGNADVDQENEMPAFYELSVAYPFSLNAVQNVEASNDKEVEWFVDVEDPRFGVQGVKYKAEENIAKYGVDADSVVIYRIPRDYFELKDAKTNKYGLKFQYSFSPKEVATFDAKEYIKATVSAESSNEATYTLKGTSIPTYKGKNELTFKKYREVLTSPIEFKNLPYFNAIAENVDGKIEIYENDGYAGGLVLANVTKADKHATGRYDDDVKQRGWAITIYKEWNASAKDWGKDDKGNYLIDTVYVEGLELPKEFFNDYDDWYDYQELLGIDYFRTSGKPSDEVNPYYFRLKDDNSIIDCSGNVTNEQIIAIDAVFRCEREDFNVSDDESLAPSKLFELNPEWAYSPYFIEGGVLIVGETKIGEKENIVANPCYFSGADFAAGKNGAIYEGPIKLNMAQAFVWYKFENDKDLLSNAFNFDKNDLLGTYTGRADIFYSGYKISGLNGPKMQSRTHTVRIYAAGENMEVNNKGIATIKVFKEKIRKDADNGSASPTDDSFEFTNNGFFFTYDDTADEPNSKYIIASWKPNTTTSNIANDWRGTNVTDTLYINVDLSTAAMRESIKEDGIPVQIVYQPQNERYSLIEALVDNLTDGIIGDGDDHMKASKLNWLDHAAQFGILVDNGHNEFYTFGTTDKGMISSMTVDTKIGSYANFAEFVNNRFLDKPNGHIHGVYKDAYPKDHGTYYVGSDCLNSNPREREFIISGLNMIDDVEILINSMASDSTFKKQIVAVPDADGEGYGSVTKKNDRYILSPNKYGEMLFVVNTTFAPTAGDRVLATDTVIAVGGESRMKHYVKDTINLIPVQTDGHDKIYFYDLDKKNHGYRGDGKRNIFNHYAAYATDTLSTVIKGDVRVPEVWLSSNIEGTDTIDVETFKFGTIIAGEDTDSVIYVQGKDLPLDLDDAKLDGNVVEPILQIIADGNFEVDIEALDIHTTAKDYCAANNFDYVDGIIAAPVAITATPDCDDLCSVEGVFTVDGLCGNLKKDAKLAFAPVLKSGFDVTVNKTNGGVADISWETVLGAQYYTVSVGNYKAKQISENVFISNMVAQNDKITVTLYNGTGADINSDMTINYMLAVTGIDAKGDTVYTAMKKGKELNQTVWKSNVPYNFTFETPLADGVKYVIGLYEFDTTAKNQIDIYEFDGIYSKLNRKYTDGNILPMNKGAFNTADWSTLTVKLPELGFVPVATSEKTTTTKITAVDLLARTTYDVVVTAYNDCLKDADNKTQEFKSADAQIASSISEGGDGNIQFEGVESPSVSNETISTTAIKAIGGKRQITILNAAGQKAVVANVLGQIIANTVLSSDNVTFPASAGMVVVNLEDGTVLKAMVK